MRTSIRFSTQTLLMVTALCLTLVLVVVAILVGLQRAFPAQTYIYQSYDLEVSPSPPGPWHPGQSLSLVWIPSEASSSPDRPPPAVTCQFWIYGPYATRAGAPTDQGGPMITGATPVASAPPLDLSAKIGSAPPGPVTYVLPATLAPGYYVVVESVTDEGDTGGSSRSWVVEVIA